MFSNKSFIVITPTEKPPKRTRELVIHILSDTWPLSAKKIYNIMRKEHGHSVSYQAVHKVLKEMTEASLLERKDRLYQLDSGWIKNLKGFSCKLEKMYKIKSESNSNLIAQFKVHPAPDDFYRNLTRMCRHYSQLWLATKTPAMILTIEQKMSPLRKEYYTTMMDRMAKGKLQVKYLFSTEMTKNKILEENDFEALRRMRTFLNLPGMEVKHAPLSSVFTLAMAKRECMIGFASPSNNDLVGILHLKSEDMTELTRIYESMFAHAQNPLALVEELEAKLSSGQRAK